MMISWGLQRPLTHRADGLEYIVPAIERIRMVSVRESRMTRPEIADDAWVSLSTVNRQHIPY
jgi:hypothetical protein